jgi:hypothetical protein
MAKSQNTARESWAAYLEPDAETAAHYSHAGPGATQLTACGEGWDAVVIAPLERGLAALDALDLPPDVGHPVIADYSRCELIVQVPAGTAHRCAGIQGVRPLSRGSWLLVPTRETADAGTWLAAWLSPPSGLATRYVDPASLREALLTADEERVARARC